MHGEATSSATENPTRLPLRRGAWPALLASLLIASCARAQCSGNTSTLSVTPPRVGELTTITIGGPADASYLLVADLVPGSTPAPPYGTLCVGFSPALITLASGNLLSSGFAYLPGQVPFQTSLAGVTIYLQAATQDPLPPYTIALTNGVAATITAPRMFVTGLTQSGGPPGTLVAALDPITSQILFTFQQPVGSGALRVTPDGSRIYTMQVTPAGSILHTFDGYTGAFLTAIPLPAGMGTGTLSWDLTPDSQRAIAVSRGIVNLLGGTSTPGAVAVIDLALNVVTSVTQLTGATPDALLIDANAPRAWLAWNGPSNQFTNVVVFNFNTLVEEASISLQQSGNVISSMNQAGNAVFVTRLGDFIPGGGGQASTITKIDAATLAVAGPRLTLGSNLAQMRGLFAFGATQQFVLTWLDGVTQQIVDPATLASAGTVLMPFPVAAMSQSDGASELLAVSRVTAGQPCSLMRIDVALLAPSNVASLPPTQISGLAVLKSTAIHRGYYYQGGQLFSFPTDPASTPIPTLITLPNSPSSVGLIPN